MIKNFFINLINLLFTTKPIPFIQRAIKMDLY